MTTSQDIADRILSISETRYANPDEDYTDLEQALSDTDFNGIAIRTPVALNSGTQRELPLLVASKITGLRGWEVPSEQNSVLVTTDMLRRKVYIAPLYPMPSNKTPARNVAQPPKPTGASAIAEVSGINRFDARAVLSLPHEPALYRVTALAFDWKSNTVETRVTAGNAPLPAAVPVTPKPTAADANKGLPTWLASPVASSVAQGRPPTAAFRIEVGTAPAPRLKAIGSFSVIADAMLIPESPYGMNEVGGVKKSVGAQVPATLAVFMRNGISPIRRDITVPIYADKPVKAGDLLNGYFVFDVLPDGKPMLSAGDYVAYLIVEGHIFGPVTFSVSGSGS